MQSRGLKFDKKLSAIVKQSCIVCSRISAVIRSHTRSLKIETLWFKTNLQSRVLEVLKGYIQYRYGLVVRSGMRGRVQRKHLVLAIALFLTPASVKFQHPSTVFFLYPRFTTFSRLCIRYRDHGCSPTQLGYRENAVHVSMYRL